MPRHATSDALLRLRRALGKTQQTFAVEVFPCAISTIARWETITPPEGDALDQLASIAYQHKLYDIGNLFLKARVEETKKKWSEMKEQFPDFFMIQKTDAEREHGYMVKRFDGLAALELANMLILLEPFVSAGDPEGLRLLSQLKEGVMSLTSKNPLVYKMARAFTYAVAAGLPQEPKGPTTKPKSRKRRK